MQNDLNAKAAGTGAVGAGGLVLCWSLGVAVVQLCRELPALIMVVAAAAGAGIAALLVRRFADTAAPWRPVGLGLCAALAVGLAGAGWSIWRAELRLADALPERLEGRELRVTGTVAALPDHGDRGSRLVLAVERAETAAGEPADVPRRVLLYVADGHPQAPARHFQPGERWRFAVRLRRPHGEMNPGGFDVETWMFQQGIRATGNVRGDPPPQRLEGVGGDWRTGVEAVRAAIRARLVAGLDGAPHAGVVVGLAIGDQRAIPPAAWQRFAATGTSHLMSISGLHVTMLAGLAGALVGGLWRRVPALVLRWPVQRARVIAGVLAAAGYTLLAGAGIPAQRTLFMLAIAGIALWRGGRPQPGRILLVALALVLALDPWAPLTAGFWLSFAAVGVLLFAAVGAAQAGGGWRAVVRSWGLAQWAVTVGTLPLVLWLFQQVSLVSPLANALAIPLVSAVVAPLSVAGGLLPAPLGGWLAQAAHAALVPLMMILDFLATQVHGLWEQARPPLWAAVLGAVGALCLLLPRGVPGRAAGGVLLVPLLAPPGEAIAPGEARVSLFDVGQGQATLVRTQRHALLFDTGPARGSGIDAGQRFVLPALRAIGVARLDLLMVSHEDADHAGGLASVFAGMPVAAWQSSIPDEHALRALGPPHRPCVAGDAWQWDGVRFTVLHPSPGAPARESEANARSCVLSVEAGGQRLLLTGDIEAGEEALLVRQQPAALAARFLQAPHHGSRSSSSLPFLSAVQPEHVLIPVGYRNAYRHPHPEVLDRYAGLARQVWRTDRDGAVHILLGELPGVTSERRLRARYWHGR